MNKSIIYVSLVMFLLFSCEKKPVEQKYKIPNYRVSSYANENPNEVSVSMNHYEPDNVVIGSNLNYYYWSFTGGTTWSERTLTSSLYGVYGDPVLMFDNTGVLYYCHLSDPPGPPWVDRIVVQRSASGGQTWEDAIGIGLNGSKTQDKEWITFDRSSSAYSGNLYLSWTEFDAYESNNPDDKSRIRFALSDDRSESWSEPIVISDTEGDCLDDDNTMEGAVPAVGNSGEVYIAWAGPEGIYFDKSLDGGVTFGTDMIISDMPGGWAFDIPGISRCNGMPFTVVDNSDSTYSDNVYVMWSDQRAGADDTEIFILKSEDNGATWQPRKVVKSDGAGSHQFLPNIVVDPVTGIIYIVYYDRSKTTGNETEVWMARSDDGAESFEHFKLSNSSFTPVDTIFFGDYIDIDANNGTIYAAWMKMDNAKRSIWCAKILESRLDELE